MLHYVVSPHAEDDILEILIWTEEHFGERARIRYQALLEHAILDLAENPDRPGATNRPELIESGRTYHLVHSRDSVPMKIGRVRKPRHVLVYRVSSEVVLEVGRVLHDSVDLPRHLPPDFGGDSGSISH